MRPCLPSQNSRASGEVLHGVGGEELAVEQLAGRLLGDRLGAVLAELGRMPVPGCRIRPGTALAVEAVDLVEPGQRGRGAAYAHLADGPPHRDGDGRGAGGGVGRRLDLDLRLVDVAGRAPAGTRLRSGRARLQLERNVTRSILPRRAWPVPATGPVPATRTRVRNSRPRGAGWREGALPLRAPVPRPGPHRQPRPHGAADADARDRPRRRTQRADEGVLRPARERRAGDLRGHPDQPRGQGLHGHPRHLQRRAGRGLARDHRRRARGRRPDRRPAVARRPGLARVLPRRRAPGVGERAALPQPHHRARCGRQPDPGQLPDPARAGARRDPAPARGLPPRDRQRPRGRLRPRRDPRRPRLPPPPVPRRRQQPAHGRVRRHAARTGPG